MSTVQTSTQAAMLMSGGTVLDPSGSKKTQIQPCFTVLHAIDTEQKHNY